MTVTIKQTNIKTLINNVYHPLLVIERFKNKELVELTLINKLIKNKK